jgi:hypothetical protein
MKKERLTARLVLCLSIIPIIFIGCTPDRQEYPMASIDKVQDSAWQELGKKRIYFGHHSVGQNIIDGVKEVQESHPMIQLNITEVDDSGTFDAPQFGHSRIGENRVPRSKIEGFKALMDKGLGEKVDIAFFKFCFVDISRTTDVEQLFREYATAIEELEATYSDTAFLHVTVPLVSKESTLRTVLKKILGKSVRAYEDNAVRTRFNDKLRATYGKENKLFDLAKIESTHRDGTRLTYTKGNEIIYTLVPRYTDDGGHLNEVGRKLVGEQFLIFLSSIVEE